MNFKKTGVGNFWALIVLLIVGSILNACNGSGGGGNTSNGNNTTVSLGILSNGSSVQSSSDQFALSGKANYTGVLTMSVSSFNSLLNSSASNLPTITMKPESCVLTAGNPRQSSCEYIISTTSSVTNGTYIITPTFTNESGIPRVLSNLFINVTNGPTLIAGNLSIMVNNPNLITGESTAATVTLSGSANVSDLIVYILSSNTSVLSIEPQSCNLSTVNNSCQVHITGLAAGNAVANVSATGYNYISSDTITVNSPVVPGNLSVTLGVSDLAYGESTTATVTLTDSSRVNGLSVNISSGNNNIATVIPGSCTVSSANNTCQVSVIGGSQTDTTAITASANEYTAAQADINVAPIVKYAYVSNRLSDSISMYSLNAATGQLSLFNTAKVTVTPNGIIANRSGTNLYLLNQNFLGMCSVNSQSGMLSPVKYTAFNILTAIAPDVTGQYLYATDFFDQSVFMYSVNGATNTLTPLNPPSIATESQPVRLVIDPSNKCVYVTNPFINTISMYKIESSTGQLTALNPASVPSESSSIAMLVDKSGHYLYVTSVGAQLISTYNIDSNTGLLADTSSVALPESATASIITTDPSGKYIYVVDTLLSRLFMYKIDPNTGGLTPLSPGIIPLPTGPTAFTFDPFGKYAYITNQASTISRYSLNESNGVLTPFGSPVATGSFPTGITFN